MIKSIAWVLLFPLTILAQVSQPFSLITADQQTVRLQFNGQNYTPVRQVVQGELYEDFSSLSRVFTMEKDAPELPLFTESVVVPATGGLKVEVTHDGFEEFQNVLVLPSKGSLKRNIDPATIPYSFGNVYAQDAFYPGNLAVAGQPFILRNTRAVTLQVYPYQYNPVSKVLRVYKNISVSVIQDYSIPAVNTLGTIRNQENITFLPLYRALFLNSPAYTPLQDEGELLIIAPDNYLDVVTPYVQWKKEKGMQTALVTLSQIGNTPEDIKNYISNYYAAHPNLTFVQLVGDHEDLPSYSYGTTGANEELWSDTFYGQMTEDFFPELLVGRFSGSTAQVKTMIDRTLEYEISPLEGDWMLGAIGIGSNEGYGFGDDGEADWEHLRNISYRLSDFGYVNFYEFFEGSQGGFDAAGNPTPSMINNALNAGVGLLNYTGHGAQNVMATGDYTIGSLNQLSNSGKYPFVVSVACNNGTFVNGTALCEAFIRRSYNGTPAGAIGSCGSSILMAWAEPMQTQDEIAELIVRSNLENIRTSLGGLFYNGQLSMMEAYAQSGTATELMQTWVLFGDVTTLFRSQQTEVITANHEMEMSAEGGILHVLASIDDALVALSQDGVIMATGLTANGGLANFEIPQLSSTAPIKVTITKPNTMPYRGQVEISALGVTDFDNTFALYPNPAHDQITISSVNLPSAWVTLYDMHGRLVFESQAGTTQFNIPTQGYQAGVYVLAIQANGEKIYRKVIIQ